MLSLPLRGAGRRDGSTPSRPKPRPSCRCGISHHLCLSCRVDRRLPAQGCPRCGDVLWSQANHAHSVVDPTSSSTTVAMAGATTVLIGQTRWRRSRKRGRRRVVGAWKKRKPRGDWKLDTVHNITHDSLKLKPLQFDGSFDYFEPCISYTGRETVLLV